MVTDVREVKGDENAPHMFEIIYNNGAKSQYICQNAAELHRWTTLLSLALISTVITNVTQFAECHLENAENEFAL